MDTSNASSGMFEFAVILALTLPLISFIINILVGNRYSWITPLIANVLMLGALIFTCIVVFKSWNNTAYTDSVEWFAVGSHSFSAGIYLNKTSLLMMLVVNLISFLVHVFSVGYMAGDAAEKRYFGMLGLFTFAMLGIVFADNLLLLFVFWELVGFSSYMLIGHWKFKPEAAAAAKKAFVMNRVGDAAFLIALMIIWRESGSFSVIEMTSISGASGTIAGLCLFGGVMGKSAQFPLFTWLPDAMEGPTPVSALIHAATMVAAGVFLLVRVFPVFTPPALAFIASIGILTALIGALSALVQIDIKRILAYSTISQLGLMVTAIGAGSPDAAMLHLFTHAFFKACLFLCAGSIIHSLHQAQNRGHVHFNVQDIRNLGGLRRKLPFTFIAVAISGAALAGLPLFTGFLSKEAILSAMYSWKGDSLNGRWVIFALAFIVSFITVLYMIRFFTKIFFGEENATRKLAVHEAPPIMRAPIALLMIFSLWITVSLNPLDPNGWLLSIDQPHNWYLTAFSVVWIASALGVAYYIYAKRISIQSNMLGNAFYLDRFYHWAVISPVNVAGYLSDRFDRRVIDRGLHGIAYGQVIFAHLMAWFDSAIVDGAVRAVAWVVGVIGSLMRSFQGGKIQLYVFWPLFAIIIFLIWSLINH